jgi:transposase
MQGQTLEAAAAAAGMSERSARTWQDGPMPSATTTARTWRTRADPFAAVWATQIEPYLRSDEDGALLATTLMDELCRRHPGEFEPGQLRTLQRQIRRWRAMHGPAQPVMFPQDHEPGQLGAFDFTHCEELGVTIGGVIFVHLMFQFVLAWSGWRYISLALGETYEALLSGLQGAFWALGGVPARVRQDNLSAATHALAEPGGRTLTKRFAEVVEHYRFESSRIQPGEAHENGVAEKANDLLKTALQQALILRGSRDFPTVEAYLAFARAVVDERFHRHRVDELSHERTMLKPLPAHRLPEYTQVDVVVRRWSTVHVAKRVYSVPSRLIGHALEARVHPDVVEIWLGNDLLEKMPRLRGRAQHRIDYRHVIWSLVRKPGAFAAYRYREDLFPTLAFRRGYDALRTGRGDRADVEYVRILHLAASTSEADVARALEVLLERGAPFDYAAVKAIARPAESAVPHVDIGVPALGTYDELITMAGAA